MHLSQSYPLYTVAQIRALEQQAIAEQASADTLMQRAGAAALRCLSTHWPKAKQLIVFCGPGNNGGDGYVMAALAKAAGLAVSVRYVGALDKTPVGVLQACRAAGVDVQVYDPSVPLVADVIIDALLGIGLNAPVKDVYAQAIVSMNTAQIPILAIDVPSGIAADSGRVCGIAVHATRTVTFIGLKCGLVTGEAPAYSGIIHCDNLDLPAAYFQAISPLATTLAWQDLPPRRKNAHKGDFGHVLIIGGNHGMGGAVCLAASAAARSGAGLISVATRAQHIAPLLANRPEVMAHVIDHPDDLIPLLARATIIVLGPGLGQDAWAQALYQAALASDLPKVIDADALNLLAQHPVRQPNAILTPHPGEAARLLNCTTTDIQLDRYLAAQQLQQRYDAVIVLKGAGSIVQGAATHVCTAGNPGMASGGMGDVLAGLSGALIAQGLDLEKAAEVGVLLHALAADKAALAGGERGLLAMDVVEQLRISPPL